MLVEAGKARPGGRGRGGVARALRVEPRELTSENWKVAAAPETAQADSSLLHIEALVDRYELGEDPDVPVREWPSVATDVRRLVELMHVTSDYTAQGELVPGLLGELHGAYQAPPRAWC